MADGARREAIEKLIAGLNRGDVSVMDEVFRDEKIARETAYWATPGPPAEWRSAWVEPLGSPEPR